MFPPRLCAVPPFRDGALTFHLSRDLTDIFPFLAPPAFVQVSLPAAVPSRDFLGYGVFFRLPSPCSHHDPKLQVTLETTH